MTLKVPFHRQYGCLSSPTPCFLAKKQSLQVWQSSCKAGPAAPLPLLRGFLLGPPQLIEDLPPVSMLFQWAGGWHLLCYIPRWHIGIWSLLPEEIVQTKASKDNLHNLRFQADSGSEHSEAVCKNSKCVFYHASCSGQPVIVNSLFPVEVSEWVWLHEVRAERPHHQPAHMASQYQCLAGYPQGGSSGCPCSLLPSGPNGQTLWHLTPFPGSLQTHRWIGNLHPQRS